jgi:hypothetical protein
VLVSGAFAPHPTQAGRSVIIVWQTLLSEPDYDRFVRPNKPDSALTRLDDETLPPSVGVGVEDARRGLAARVGRVGSRARWPAATSRA